VCECYPLTNLLKLRILWPRVARPLVLDLDDVHKPGLHQLLLVVRARVDGRAQLLAGGEEVAVPLGQGGVGGDSAVVAGERQDVAQLEVAAWVEVAFGGGVNILAEGLRGYHFLM